MFVLGMYDSGVELVHSLLGHMGLRSLGAGPDDEAHPLAALNGRLLEAAEARGPTSPRWRRGGGPDARPVRR